MEKLKSYIIELKKNGVIKSKVYLADYIVRRNNCWPVIIITYDKCSFSANNGIQKA